MMRWIDSLPQAWLALQHFMTQGGTILWVLATCVFLTGILVIERLLFIWRVFPKYRQVWIQQWQKRSEHESWFAQTAQARLLHLAHHALFQYLSLIKVTVSLFPMLGLLGTVTGMMTVFDVMAQQGQSNPKLMATGISLATLPTMAGMVATLFGLFIHARLLKRCQTLENQFEQALRRQS